MIHIEHKVDCCGCRACEQSCPHDAISMERDDEGFLYPKVDEPMCVSCGLCEKVCPVKNPSEGTLPTDCFAAVSNDDEIRRESSSGGIFSELAGRVIKEGGVVFGAAFAEDYTVSHIMVSSLSDLKQLRGSKYLQSDTGDSFVQCRCYLEKGVPVLYSGTPCQIAGLKHYLHKEYTNLLLVDVICHGVPSPDVWKKYLEGKKLSRKDESSVSFRDKTEGWRKFSLAISQNGEVTYISPQQSDVYMQLFLQNVILRPSCYQCSAKAGKSGSDITIADFWGIENAAPEMDDDKGTSLVMINSSKGEEWFSATDCRKKKVPSDLALAGNGNWKCSAGQVSGRKLFFQQYRLWKNFNRSAFLFLHPEERFIPRMKSLAHKVLRKVKRII